MYLRARLDKLYAREYSGHDTDHYSRDQLPKESCGEHCPRPVSSPWLVSYQRRCTPCRDSSIAEWSVFKGYASMVQPISDLK